MINKNNVATFFVEDYRSLLPMTKDKNTVLAIGNVQSGKTRFMISETKSALKGDYDFVILLGGTNHMLLKQSYSRFNKDLRETGFPVYEVNSLEPRGLRGSKKILTSLKGKAALEKLLKIVSETIDKKILIFDDESDFASINTSKVGYTKIFSLVHGLYDNMESGTFVSVTATPFADILSDDAFNFDHIIRLQPGKGYKGLSEFNESNIYSVIDLDDFRDGGSIKEWISIMIEHIKTIVKIKSDMSQLLINTSLTKKSHAIIKENIFRILTIMNSQRMGLMFDVKNPLEAMVYKEKIEELLKNVYVLNQENSQWNNYANSIIIGGALVSRGYTFENLITTIMFNVPSQKVQADTLLQRARWFGYRESFEHMKVYMTSKLKMAYLEIQELNKIIFNHENNVEDMKKKISELDLGIVEPSGKI